MIMISLSHELERADRLVARDSRLTSYSNPGCLFQWTIQLGHRVFLRRTSTGAETAGGKWFRIDHNNKSRTTNPQPRAFTDALCLALQTHPDPKPSYLRD